MRLLFLALLAAALGTAQAADDAGVLFSSAQGTPIGKTIDGLLVNSAQGHVSAAALASINGESMTVAQDVKDFSLLLKGLDKDFQTFGFSITPARTRSPLPAINLADYAKGGLGTRMLGALTLGYAQGKNKELGKDWERRAFSLETSAFWSKDEDPVIAMASECGRAALSTPDDEADRPGAALEAAATGASAPAASASAPQRTVASALAATPTDAAANKKAVAAFNACIAPTLKRLSDKWNRTRYSISYGTGWVRPADRSLGQQSLGHTVAAGLVYGFDGLGSQTLRDNAAITLTLRRSINEPVLASLGTPNIKLRDSSLVAIRISGGSAGFRGLFEYSNAGKKDVTTTQRTFIQALGIDYAVSGVTVGDLWLSLRYGKQRKLDGSGEESGSLLTLSYSGKPDLPR
jgi:hypothetical protein